jgi:hypothetical protein
MTNALGKEFHHGGTEDTEKKKTISVVSVVNIRLEAIRSCSEDPKFPITKLYTHSR